MVQTQRCSFFMGMRGTKHSSNHIRDLTGIVDAEEQIMSELAELTSDGTGHAHRCGTWDRSSG